MDCSAQRCRHRIFFKGHCLSYGCPNYVRKCDRHKNHKMEGL